MVVRSIFGSLVVVAAAMPAPVRAEADRPVAHLAAAASSFSLASPSVAPPRDTTFVPAADTARADGAMPRELPAVPANDARPIPTPGVDWHPGGGAVIRLRPAKVRLKLGF